MFEKKLVEFDSYRQNSTRFVGCLESELFQYKSDMRNSLDFEFPVEKLEKNLVRLNQWLVFG